MIKQLLSLAKTPLYGGQAVIGGVMMKGKNNYSISLYNKNKIHTKSFPFKSLTSKCKILGLPFIRGIVNLFEMLVIGYKSLSYSTEFSYESEVDTSEGSSAFGIIMIISLFFSFIFAIALFKLLPLSIATLVNHYYELSSIIFNIVDGVVKLGIFVAYVYVIGRFADIKDVFKYHGAEHKTINCLEQGKKLTIKNVNLCSTRHLRCGTTFMLLVLVLSIVVYVFIPKELPFVYNLLLRVALLPLIASISYEIQKFSARFGFFKWILYPGLLLQALTTKEPSVRHVRCAIDSLEETMEND